MREHHSRQPRQARTRFLINCGLCASFLMCCKVAIAFFALALDKTYVLICTAKSQILTNILFLIQIMASLPDYPRGGPDAARRVVVHETWKRLRVTLGDTCWTALTAKLHADFGYGL